MSESIETILTEKELNKIKKAVNIEKLKGILSYQLQNLETLKKFTKICIDNNITTERLYIILFLIGEEYKSVDQINGIIIKGNDVSFEDFNNLREEVRTIISNGIVKENIPLYSMLSNIYTNSMKTHKATYSADNLNTELNRIFEDTCLECSVASEDVKADIIKSYSLSDFVNINGKPTGIIENIYKYSRLLNGIAVADGFNTKYSKFFQKFLENISTRTINY